MSKPPKFDPEKAFGKFVKAIMKEYGYCPPQHRAALRKRVLDLMERWRREAEEISFTE